MVDLSDFGDFTEGTHPLLTVAEARYAALTYLSLGWAVTAGPGIDANGICACRQGVECGNPGKHAHAGWGNRTRRTLTESEIERYWSEENTVWESKPVDQVFIVPYLSGLVVADVDVMETWEGLPPDLRTPTLFQKSGSGRGGHFIYKYNWDTTESLPPRLPGSLPSRCGELKFRGIIVGAPCPHKSGGRYEWENWGTEIAEVPTGLLELDKRAMRDEISVDAIAYAKRKENPMLENLFTVDVEGLASAGKATHSRPRVLFAVAATMAPWILAGWITEEVVIKKLMKAAEENGSLDDYGEDDLLRQIRNGIEAGKEEL